MIPLYFFFIEVESKEPDMGHMKRMVLVPVLIAAAYPYDYMNY
jgi:hypothetical protein